MKRPWMFKGENVVRIWWQVTKRLHLSLELWRTGKGDRESTYGHPTATLIPGRPGERSRRLKA